MAESDDIARFDGAVGTVEVLVKLPNIGYPPIQLMRAQMVAKRR